jgi:hypothetical protein
MIRICGRQLHFTGLAVFLVLMNPASRARAAVSFQYVAGQSSYTVTEGGVVVVPLYLQETLDAGSTSLITEGNGLAGAGFALSLQDGTAAGIGGLSGSVSNFPGGFYLDPGTTGSATFERGEDFPALTNISGPGAEPDSNGLILLGFTSIQASATSVGTTKFSVGAYSPGQGGSTETFTTLTGLGYYDLDLTNNGTPAGPPVYEAAGSMSFQIVTVVPEPTSTALLALGFALVFRRFWRTSARLGS